jgi:nucleotide-binding universal stress UspA family protein
VAIATAFHATLIGLLSQNADDSAGTDRHHDGKGVRRDIAADLTVNCDAARLAFDTATEHLTVAVDWRVGEGTPIDAMHCEGRLADLIIVGQSAPGEVGASATRRFIELTIVGTGPPVLVLPAGGRIAAAPWPYASAMVAWSGTRESAQALRSALPFLRLAQRVDIVCCLSDGPVRQPGDSPPSYAMSWLSRHGMKPTLTEMIVHQSGNIGDALLELTARRKADLLVCGAYGRGVLRGGVLGRVADTVLNKSPIPTLFAC